MTAPALVGLGSNLGDRRAHLTRALALLAEHPAIEVEAVSELIETTPVGGPPQDDFLNGAALLRTSLTPWALLRVLQRVERAVGRRAGGARWGPREVDLDLLLHGRAVLDTPELVVPHPRLHERAFVLGPAAAIAPDLFHPVRRRTVSQLRADLLAAADPGEEARP